MSRKEYKKIGVVLTIGAVLQYLVIGYTTIFAKKG